MGAAGLDHVAELHSLGVQGVAELVELEEKLVEKEPRADAQGRREDVVRRLRHVDVVVRMNVVVSAELSTHGHVGEVGDDLVAVHVERGPRAGLKDVDDEVLSVPREVREDAVARSDDCLRTFFVQGAELAVGEGRRALEQDECADELRMLAQPADGIVLDGALRLRAIQCAVGDVHFAQCVFFDPHAHVGGLKPHPRTAG